MQVNTDPITIVSTPRGAPVIPAAPLPASPVTDIGNAEKRTSQDQRRNPSGSPSRFRSVLDAATVAGLGQASPQTSVLSARDGVTLPQTEVTRAGNPSRDISGQDSEALYRAVRAYASNAKATNTTAESAPINEDVSSSPAFKNVALRATKSYAQAFFALDRTFAARGETLEIST